MLGLDREPGLDLEAFCHVEHARVLRLLSLHCGDVELARDLTQETLVKVCVHWRRVRRLDVPQAWVTRVALNLATSQFRRAGVRRRHDALTEREQLAPEPDEGWVVRAAVASLPVRQRTAVILRWFEDLTVEEAAEVMDVSPSAVKKLSARGLQGLRDRLGVEIEEVPHA